MIRCPSCGEGNPDRARFCAACGTPLAAPPATELRKTVTILCSDLKGSTALGEALDPESLREVLGRYFAEMKRIIERHGGTLEKYIGDAIMAVFGIPRAHEDDALRAVRAAWEMKQALQHLNDELRERWGVALANRTGVNTGPVVAGDARTGQRLVTGDTVNVAARLEQAAPELEVLIGEWTWRLTRDAIDAEPVQPLTLKGKSEAVAAYRLTGVRAGTAEGFSRRLDAPMVGRAAELAALERAFERTTVERRCGVVTILGHAGLGKTRLLEEFLRRTLPRDAKTFRGRCLPYGEGITFWPFAEVVRQAAAIRDDDPPEDARAKLDGLFDGPSDAPERLASIIGLSSRTFGIRETFWAARKLLEALARSVPVVVVFEDMHWAEPTLLDLIEHVADTAEDASVLIVCTGRPELLEDRPRWMASRPGAERILLAPLSADETARVAATLLGQSGLPPRIRAAITSAAEGNPLFVEQTISMLADEGALRPDDHGGWTLVVEPAAIAVPPTISALLSARLDRLGEAERAVLQAGSIPGPVFHEGAVMHLSAAELRPAVHEHLTSLTGKLLIASAPQTLVDDHAFRFQHILIRESAYDSLLKRARAEMHELYVGWLERVAGPSAMDLEEIVGHHLERAFRYLADLGPVDAKARTLAMRASSQLSIAGRRALARGDMPAAASLLDRAIDLLPTSDAMRLPLVTELAEALVEMGRFGQADQRLAAAIDDAHAAEERIAELNLRLARLVVRRSLDRTDWAALAMREATDAIPTFEAADDHAGLARAWRILAAVHGGANRYAAAEEASRNAVRHAALAGARHQTRTLYALAQIAVVGPTPVPEAIALCERLIDSASGDQRVQAMIRALLAQLRAMAGEFDEARELYSTARSVLDDLGVTVQAAATALYSGRVELLAGCPDRAEALLREAYDTLRRLGEKSFITSIATVLAEALVEQGRDEEADEIAGFAETAAAPDDVDAQFRWRAVRARVLARRGRIDEALTLARGSVGIMRRTDALAKLGTALSALTDVLRLSGRTVDAIAVAREARSVYAAKGSTVSAHRIRAILAGLEGRVLVGRERARTR